MGRPRKLKFKSKVQAELGDTCLCGKPADFRVEFTPKPNKNNSADICTPYLAIGTGNPIEMLNSNNCICDSCFKDRFLVG